MNDIATETVIRSLLGQNQVSLAIKCLSSLSRYSSEPVTFIFHDDGTLQPQGMEDLQMAFPKSTLVLRRDADQQIDGMLANYPASRTFRKQHPLALKLLDVPLLSERDMAFCDTDILFFRPFKQLFAWPDQKTEAIFMLDHKSAFSVTHPGVFIQGVRFVKCLNSGLIFLRKASYDLDFVEWFLSLNKGCGAFHWAEQTAWAALASRLSTRVWSSSQIVLILPESLPSREMVAGHFVTNARSLVATFERTAPDHTDAVAVPIDTVPADVSSGLKTLISLLPIYRSYFKRVVKSKIASLLPCE